jgi:hypothetical protein
LDLVEGRLKEGVLVVRGGLDEVEKEQPLAK